MAAIVGALRAVLSLESAAFQAGLTNAQKSLQQFDKRMKALGGKIQIVGAAVSAAGAGIAAAMRTQINAADDMSKAAQKFGVPIEQLSRLKYAADLSDISFESLGQSLGRLSKGMVNSPAQFAELGVALNDASGRMRDADAVMSDVADVFASMPDGAQKTALALKLFGKSGADMIPLLNGGSAEINKMTAEADALGLTLSAETGAAAEAFNDDLTRLGSGMQGLVRQITAALLPTLQGFVDRLKGLTAWFANLSPEARDFAAKLALITIAAGPAIVGLGLLISSLGTVLATLRALALLAVANPIGLALSAIATIALVIITNWEPIKAFFIDLWESVSTAATDAWQAVKNAWAAVPAWFENLLMVELPRVFEAAWEAIRAKFTQWVEDFKQVGRDIMKGLTDGILGSRDMSSTAMGDAMGGLIGTAEDAVDSHSPSRVFQKIGHYIMEGLGLGIAEGAPTVQASMASVASAIGDGGLKEEVGDLKADFSSMFRSIIDGSASAGEALSGLLSGLGGKLLDAGLSGLMDFIFPNANGNAFSAGRVTAFARGGVVSGPTAFQMPGGMGLMGEAGPEAIMPLTRVGGKLGVMATGGGGVNVHFTVNAQGASKGVDELIVEALRRETPRIVDRSVAAVADSGRRGRNTGMD